MESLRTSYENKSFESDEPTGNSVGQSTKDLANGLKYNDFKSDVLFSENELKHAKEKEPEENEPPSLSCCDRMACFQSKKPMSRLRIIKNLIVISFAFLLFFTAFNATSNLQSTMNSENQIGVKSLIATYSTFVVSVMFLPLLLIKRLGCKYTLVLSFLTVSTYIASNFYLHLASFIPTAMLSGFAGGTLWACNCTYLTKIGFLYSSYVREPAEVIVAKFFGIFYVFLESTQIWGSLVSYFALKSAGGEEDFGSNETLLTCGAYFCSQVVSFNVSNPNLRPPTDGERFLLTGILVSCVILAAVVIGLFLDPLDSEQDGEKKHSRVSDLLLASLLLLRKKNLILLVPITIFLGLQQGFYMTQYTQAFIACVWGVHHVGYVTICFGIVSSVTSCLLGPMVKCFSRAPVVLLAATGNTITSIYMLLWTPTADEPVVLFVIAGVWGFGDAIWWVLLDAAYGVLFENDEEAAFSNFYFWNSIGFILMFICSNYLCVPVTIYILLSCLFVGIAGYLTVEMKSFCGKKCKYDMDKGS